MTGNSNYTENRNTDADFKNGNALDKRFGDHGSDLGSSSSQDYLNSARDFVDNPLSEVESFTDSSGGYYQYEASSNTFGIINQHGGILTYFKPDAGINYWLEQIMKYKP
ncbi:hemagglutination protein [Erysipelothrix urinaevulpis]|uniref:hemagglutination protein n=1 Tax=Erysipelothrix urinaevulpis TaxID=2683717 RepID=UPI00135C49CA|nr:hemagglutination protein [Erysipelothrix urinaevulpis]